MYLASCDRGLAFGERFGGPLLAWLAGDAKRDPYVLSEPPTPIKVEAEVNVSSLSLTIP